MAVIVVIAGVVAAVAIGAYVVRRPRAPVDNPWLWEGIRIAFADGAGHVVTGEYMARPAVYRAAVNDWAFSTRPTPILVLFDATRGVEIHRASVDRVHAEYQVRVQGLSVSHAMPPRAPEVPDDDTRRDGGPFSADIGFYFEPRAEPWQLRVHAELGPLRSESITREIVPR